MASMCTSLRNIEADELSEGDNTHSAVSVSPDACLSDLKVSFDGLLLSVFAAAEAFVKVIWENERILGIPRSLSVLASNDEALLDMLLSPETSELGLQAQHLLPALLESSVSRAVEDAQSQRINPLHSIRDSYAGLRRSMANRLGI